MFPPSRAPTSLWIMALLALTPFPASALAYTMGPAAGRALALEVMLTWSAVVLSFLGGVRWGLETGRPAPRAGRLASTILSPILAWIMFVGRDRLDARWVLVGFLAAFLAQWLFDHAAPDVPTRWPRLTTALTLGACVSLAVMLEDVMRM
jgi:uncharacterized MnhB-related membrane protein